MAVTLKRIAEETGLSVATVSIAIRGKSAGKFSLSPDTIKTVRDVAGKLGYRTNRLAASLTSSSTKMVGVLIAALHGDYYEKILAGIEREIAPEYTPLLGVHNYDSSRERNLLDGFICNRVDGLIAAFSGAAENIEMYRTISEVYKIPVVLVDRPIPSLKMPLVRCDHFNQAFQATKTLLDLGHRRIHLISAVGFLNPEYHQDGYFQAMKAAGCREDVKITISPYTKGWGKDGLRKFAKEVIDSWQVLEDRASAFVVQNDWLAYEILAECHERGIRVPEDISIMGLDDCLPSSMIGVELSSVAQVPDEIGFEAAKYLLGSMNGYGDESSNIILPVEVKVRKTTARIS